MKFPEYFYFRVRTDRKGTSITLEVASDVDVVEVVRCKDCQYNYVTTWNHGKQDDPRCDFTDYKLTLNDYCSKGTPR